MPSCLGIILVLDHCKIMTDYDSRRYRYGSGSGKQSH